MIDAELAALHAYQEKHSTCDIQQHPWQAVFGAGFEAGVSTQERLTAEIERLRGLLREAKSVIFGTLHPQMDGAERQAAQDFLAKPLGL